MAYVLDANVFITAKRLHYGLDFCPAFWDWMIQRNEEGSVFSIDKVKDELRAGADDLWEWCESLGADFFLRPDAAIGPSMARVSTWAQSQSYTQAAVGTFLQVADYFLVAQALAGNLTVVTHEVPSGSERRTKIPDACLGLDVAFVSAYEMLRRERARFVLGRSSANR